MDISTFYEKPKIRDSQIQDADSFSSLSVLVAISGQEKWSQLSDPQPQSLPKETSFPEFPVKPQCVTWNV